MQRDVVILGGDDTFEWRSGQQIEEELNIATPDHAR